MALSFFTDDAVWFNPKGIFRGKEELEKYINWLFDTVSDMKFIDDGVGIIVQGNKGIFQHIFECTFRGSRIKVPTFCTYLFNGQKCKIHKTIKTKNFSPLTNKMI
jgi:ketosteroid isomerase-like protein